MSEIIERLAKAQYERWVGRQMWIDERLELSPRPAMPWALLEDEKKARWLADARMDIEVLREPSDGMLSALPNELGHSATLGRIVWETMINQGLR